MSRFCTFNNYTAEDFGIAVGDKVVLKKAACWIGNRIKNTSDYVAVSDGAKQLCKYFSALEAPTVILLKTVSEGYKILEKKYRLFADTFSNDLSHFAGFSFSAPYEKLYTEDAEKEKLLRGCLYSNSLDCYFVKLKDSYGNTECYPLGFILDYAADVIPAARLDKIKNSALVSLLNGAYCKEEEDKTVINIPESHVEEVALAENVLSQQLSEEKAVNSKGDICALDTNISGVGRIHLLKLGCAMVITLCSSLAFILHCVRNPGNLFNFSAGAQYFSLLTVTELCAVAIAVLMLFLQPVRLVRAFPAALSLYKRARAAKAINSYNGKRAAKKICLSVSENATDISDIEITRTVSFAKAYKYAFKSYKDKEFEALGKRIRYAYTMFFTVLVALFIYASQNGIITYLTDLIAEYTHF